MTNNFHSCKHETLSETREIHRETAQDKHYTLQGARERISSTEYTQNPMFTTRELTSMFLAVSPPETCQKFKTRGPYQALLN